MEYVSQCFLSCKFLLLADDFCFNSLSHFINDTYSINTDAATLLRVDYHTISLCYLVRTYRIIGF